jgi:hypothetical protein
MPTARLLNSLGREQIPLKLITVQLELKKWVDNLKIYKLTRAIETEFRTPVFTNGNDTLYNIQLHTNDLQNQFWQDLADEPGVSIFVTDTRKL